MVYMSICTSPGYPLSYRNLDLSVSWYDTPVSSLADETMLHKNKRYPVQCIRWERSSRCSEEKKTSRGCIARRDRSFDPGKSDSNKKRYLYLLLIVPRSSCVPEYHRDRFIGEASCLSSNCRSRLAIYVGFRRYRYRGISRNARKCASHVNPRIW